MKKLLLLAAGAVAAFSLLTPRPCGAASNLVLTSRTIVWQPGISPALSNQLIQAAPSAARVPAFVKFNNSLSLTNHQLLLASGVQLADYFRDRAYTATLPSQTFLDDSAVTNLIFSAMPVLPVDKLLLPLSTNDLPDWAYDPQSNTVKILVGFWDSVDDGTIAQTLTNSGVSGVPYGADNSWAVVGPLQAITNLANEFSVRTIELGPLPLLPLNKFVRPIVHTETVQNLTPNTAIPVYNGLSGRGIKIGICDTGVDEDHNDFHNINSAGVSINVDPWRFYIKNLSRNDVHGTHVASIAAGNGFNSQPPDYAQHFLYRGHAPEALIGDYRDFGGDQGLFYDAINVDGTDVSNHSYVQSFTVYRCVARSLDKIVRGDAIVNGQAILARPSIWSAGNAGTHWEHQEFMCASGVDCKEEEGYYSVYTSAKNTISVGSIDTSTLRRSSSSSLGPTFDGRVKPDVVAPGNRNAENGISAAYFDSQGYESYPGTSQAAPVVTGIIALMMEKYRACTGTCPKLAPAMYKAILIHTATDLEKTANGPEDAGNLNPDTGQAVQYGKGPDFATGYGLVNAEAACEMIGRPWPTYWDQGVIGASGDELVWCIQIPPGETKTLKVVIAWDDPPGCPQAHQTLPRLVNDLDLTLEAPDGTIYRPWVPKALNRAAAPGVLPVPSDPPEDGKPDPVQHSLTMQPADRAEDHLNNVEMVSCDSPLLPGIWRVIVRGYDIPHPATQQFALVSSHLLASFCPIDFTPDRFEISRHYPWLRERQLVCNRRVNLARGVFTLPTLCPVRLDEICQYFFDCPGCERGLPWERCAGFQMNIDGLPDSAEVIIFNDAGNILAEGSARAKKCLVNVPGKLPAERQFALIVPKSKKRLEENVRLKLDIQPPYAMGGTTGTEKSNDDKFRIDLPNRQFTPRAGLDSALDNELRQADAFPVHGLVQVLRPLTEAERANLEETAGLKLGVYKTRNVYLADFSKNFRFDAVTHLVRWAGPLFPEDKIENAFWQTKVKKAKDQDKKVRIVVQFYRDVSPETVQKTFNGHMLTFHRLGLNNFWETEVALNNLEALAREPAIRSIGERTTNVLPTR